MNHFNIRITRGRNTAYLELDPGKCWSYWVHSLWDAMNRWWRSSKAWSIVAYLMGTWFGPTEKIMVDIKILPNYTGGPFVYLNDVSYNFIQMPVLVLECLILHPISFHLFFFLMFSLKSPRLYWDVPETDPSIESTESELFTLARPIRFLDVLCTLYFVQITKMLCEICLCFLCSNP